MEKIKQIGIWMDHSNAVLIDLTSDAIVQNNIVSESTYEERENSLLKGEKHMHIKDQHQQASYYKKLIDVIRNYHDVVLFGPTDAKDELVNLIKEDFLFKNIKIETHNSDKMTENQMHAFVKDYFNRK